MNNMDDLRGNETWRIFRIISEFVEGFEELRTIQRGVSIFGSARLSRNNHYYKDVMKIAELLSKKGYSIITGGGPGIMEAGNRRAHRMDEGCHAGNRDYRQGRFETLSYDG